MDNLAVQVDDVVDVKEIKVRKVRTVKPKAVDIPIVLVNPVITEQHKPSTYHYTSNDFTINFDD